MVRELKRGHLSKYVTYKGLVLCDYLPRGEVSELIAPKGDLPDLLDLRLSALEKEVVQHGEPVAQMEGHLKSLQENKKGSTVSAWPYTV